jgi:cytochrome c peroxidase
MTRSLAVVTIAALAALANRGALAAAPQAAVLDHYAAEARLANAGFGGFVAERGRKLFLARQEGGKPETPSCTTCHTTDPRQAGRTRAGQDIPPMAVSAKPERYTDVAETEKWFGRNCQSVLGRVCTAQEKGDFITVMMTQ